jgi:ZIP family zinc transporter
MNGLATNTLLEALAIGLAVGLSIPLGGLLARIEHIRPNWLEQEFRHSVMAFGGGVLIAAVALVLVPEGSHALSPPASLAAFLAGGLLFAGIERLQQRGGGACEQFLAMLADFVPEALALGALLATQSDKAALLAILIGVQNVPESFNSWREIRAGAGQGGINGKNRTMIFFLVLSLLGPAAVLFGQTMLAGRPALTGVIMLTAAGGILFLMFQAIAVKAHLKNRQTPPLAAVVGFGFALVFDLAI